MLIVKNVKLIVSTTPVNRTYHTRANAVSLVGMNMLAEELSLNLCITLLIGKVINAEELPPTIFNFIDYIQLVSMFSQNNKR